MFALLAPVEVRRESAGNASEAGKIHRAVRIAVNAEIATAILAFTFAAVSLGVIGLRIAIYAIGHAEQPFFRDLLAAFGGGQ
ncbi:MAG: hypothetical protein IT562_13350 [Alphaproteobacteria bacterium]|nr:hypothetical protein [Alphaproteobacteria bacterium]